MVSDFNVCFFDYGEDEEECVQKHTLKSDAVGPILRSCIKWALGDKVKGGGGGGGGRFLTSVRVPLGDGGRTQKPSSLHPSNLPNPLMIRRRALLSQPNQISWDTQMMYLSNLAHCGCLLNVFDI